MKHSTKPRRDARIAFALATILSMFVAEGLHAQAPPDTAAPLVPIYGIPNDHFPIYAWAPKWVKDSGIAKDNNLAMLWPYADSMGFDVFWVPIGYSTTRDISYIDQMHNSAYRDPDRHRMRVKHNLFKAAAGGRGIQFYPFDSVQSPYYIWKFTNLYGGDTALNLSELNVSGNPLTEQVYETLADTGLIASAIALDYDPDIGREIWNWYRWFGQQFRANELEDTTNIDPRSAWIAVTGHLFTGGAANDTDAVFTVALYHEVPEGKLYLDTDFTWLTAGAGGVEYLVDSFAVTKEQLKADTSLPLDRYRTIEHHIDLRWRNGDSVEPGPLHPWQPNGKDQAIDIRVYWTGKEKAALRSVELRDSVGQLLLGTGTNPESFRQRIMSDARRLLYGDGGTIQDLRTEIVAFEFGEESNYRETEFAGYNALNRMFSDTFNLPRWRVANGNAADPQPGDSLRGQQYALASEHFHHLTNQNIIHTYNYFNDPKDTVPAFLSGYMKSIVSGSIFADLGPHHAAPRIKQRNGGRFHLPELLDLDSVGIPSYDSTLEQRIRDYETTFQRRYLGRFDPDRPEYYEDSSHLYWGMLAMNDGNGYSAPVLSRMTGRRYVPVLGLVANLTIRDSVLTARLENCDTTVQAGGDTLITCDSVPLTPGFDTIASAILTESELFGAAGLGNAYGGTGLTWFTLGNYLEAAPDSTYENVEVIYNTVNGCCVGAGGLYTRDTVRNVFNSLPYVHNGSTVQTIPNVYVGWLDLTRAVKRIDRWLQKIGPELAQLRWRNGYSMHFTVPWPHSTIDTVSRPLPTDEIVNQITSRSPFRAKPDSTHRTFVEVGFFDKQTDSIGGVYDPYGDRYHIYLTNRRCFRKPKDTCWSDTSCAEDKSVTILDTLAGTRIISCRLNLEHPDVKAYNFWRVREIEPDTEPLPHAPLAARHTLDTVVAGDSIFSVVLGPGKSTLLRITPATPDTSMDAGDLRFPGQRKFIFDGKRYHSIYHQRRPAPGGGYDNVIVWRASYPITDTTGAILWMPTIKEVLSDKMHPLDTARTDNRFPSFTLRRDNDTTWMTVVWTCHPPQIGHTNEREVVMRNLKIIDFIQPYPYTELIAYVKSPIQHVDYHYGTNPEQWGTPVISYMHGGAPIAWSDSVLGIVGRLFPIGNWNTWTTIQSLSPRDSISWQETLNYGFAGQYPSVPPYTPLSRTDSATGIVWRQPNVTSQEIMYNRIGQTPTNGLMRLKAGSISFATWVAKRWYPSIDVMQMATGGTHREGIVWEDDFLSYKTLQFQSLQTSSTGVTGLWNRASYIVRQNNMSHSWPNGMLHPQTAAIGEHDTSLYGQDRIQFAIAYERPTTGDPELWQSLIDWGRDSLKTNWPVQYTFGGKHPNVAVNLDQEWRSESILYQALGIGGFDSTLRTSRQFFSKHARPTGYMAQGRSVTFRASSENRTGMHAMMYDVWYADADRAEGLEMPERDSTNRVTDNLSDVHALTRTMPFNTSDSVTIGYTLLGQFYGDSVLAGTSHVDLILELVDSGTGNVIAQLDSITINSADSALLIEAERTVDVLSGTYYVRMRSSSTSMPEDTVAYDSRYPVGEVVGWVDNELSAKQVWVMPGNSGPAIRLSAQPNPFSHSTEVRFSLPKRDYVTLELYDGGGRRIRTLMNEVLMEDGRYAIEIPAADLAAGTYIVELRTMQEHVTEKIILVR